VAALDAAAYAGRYCIGSDDCVRVMPRPGSERCRRHAGHRAGQDALPSQTNKRLRRTARPLNKSNACKLRRNSTYASEVAYKGTSLSRRSKTWRQAREVTGLDAEVGPYAVRHTVATEMCARGMPDREIAGRLGHAMPNFRTTRRYAAHAPDYLGKAREVVGLLAREIGRLAGRPI